MKGNDKGIAAIWCRVSTHDQRELSLDSQEIAVRRILEAEHEEEGQRDSQPGHPEQRGVPGERGQQPGRDERKATAPLLAAEDAEAHAR